MNDTVDWIEEAEQELAAIWLASPDRNSVTAASAEIDAALSRRPYDVGESRASTVQHIALVPPLAIEELRQNNLLN